MHFVLLYFNHHKVKINYGRDNEMAGKMTSFHIQLKAEMFRNENRPRVNGNFLLTATDRTIKENIGRLTERIINNTIGAASEFLNREGKRPTAASSPVIHYSSPFSSNSSKERMPE